MMTAYLDASVLVAAVVDDSHSERVEAWLASGVSVAISTWTVAECSSALALRLRTRVLDEASHAVAEGFLDRWAIKSELEPVLAQDVALTRQLVRDDPVLRAPDALHLAVARRLGLALATLDRQLAGAARRAGVEVADI